MLNIIKQIKITDIHPNKNLIIDEVKTILCNIESYYINKNKLTLVYKIDENSQEVLRYKTDLTGLIINHIQTYDDRLYLSQKMRTKFKYYNISSETEKIELVYKIRLFDPISLKTI